MKDFYANQYNDQATEKDDLADEDHLSDSAIIISYFVY